MLGHPKKSPTLKNAVLASLPPQDLLAISPFLESVVLKERIALQEPNKPVEHVYFVESGVVSQRVVAAGSMLETAVVGYRGAVGASFLLGGHVRTHRFVVFLPGSALRIGVDNLSRLMNERPQIREHLLRSVKVLAMHGAQMGLCGVRHNLEQRLACWLCLTCDALDGHTLPLTHDYISDLLALRRAGVTETLIRFEEQGLIRKMRRLLHLHDRKRLEEKACGCYNVLASEYSW
jgi:CRP-like cAMP-binding protein